MESSVQEEKGLIWGFQKAFLHSPDILALSQPGIALGPGDEAVNKIDTIPILVELTLGK